MASETPPTSHEWRAWPDIAELFDGPEDSDWNVDQDRVGHDIRDPDSDHRSGTYSYGRQLSTRPKAE